MSRIPFVHQYFASIGSGDLEGMLECYADEAIQVELPNRLKPQGDRRSVEDLRRDFARGREILESQSYAITSVTEDADRVAVEVLWRGRLAVPLGSLGKGDEMRARSAILFEFRDGLIVAQRNYDCFEAF